MKIPRPVSLTIFLLSAAVSVLWGGSLALKEYGMTDFRAVYYGTRCLLEGHNPYNVPELERVVADEHGERPSETPEQHQAVTLYVNLPSTFIFVAPFAMLPFGIAKMLWLGLLTGLFLLSSYLMYDLGERYAPGLSLFLVCLVVTNSLVIFGGGNTAGIAVPLCLIAVWCFLEERFVPAGIICMALSLAIKPHDSGFVWLYFLLVSGDYRKRALQALMGTAALFLAGFAWVSLVAPNWIQNWKSNLAAISSPGHINDPTPASIVGFHTLGPIIDLQSVLSVFVSDPRFFNTITYIVCGSLLLAWAVVSYRSRLTKENALVALAAVAPLTMLITYHRPWDAKLLLLIVPACAMLWSTGGPKRLALLLSAATLVMAGDIPMAIYLVHPEKVKESATGLLAQVLMVLRARPIPLMLMILGVFYIWVYVRYAFISTAFAEPKDSLEKQPGQLRL